MSSNKTNKSNKSNKSNNKKTNNYISNKNIDIKDKVIIEIEMFMEISKKNMDLMNLYYNVEKDKLEQINDYLNKNRDKEDIEKAKNTILHLISDKTDQDTSDDE